ncbi:MAG TPA: N-acetylmuramic acid 6-phosphate etherase [Micrococcaceae bacterium]|nr:N-acetylmuramic acid 6-phosphate etherase [Micrococcaceae bacterium]
MTETDSMAAPLTDHQLRRLVNRVIWPGFVGTTVPAWLAAALDEGLAGAVYFRHNIDPDSPGQVVALSAAIRAANPDAVIGADEEGGNVTRLQARDGSSVPGAAVLGRLDDVALTQAAGAAIGRMCRGAGINLVIGPVADVNTNPRNPVIGVRSFGSDTALVSRHAAAMVRGIQAAGVGACAKHFPGHGDTVSDSHLSLPRLELGLAQLERDHVPPFRAAVGAGVSAVMTAHIVIPDLGEAPATLNPAAGALLRGLGFDGLLITDALDMAAVRTTVGPGAGAVQALLAGADLLCVGNPENSYSGGGTDEGAYLEVRDALLGAVADAVLPLEVLRRAGGRVAAFAAWVRQQETSASGDAGDGDAAARNGTADPAGWSEDGFALAARRACDVVEVAGPALLPAGTGSVVVLDARTDTNMAAGPAVNYFAAALAQDMAVRTVTPAELSAEPSSQHAADAPEGLLVLVDSLADPRQWDAMQAVARTTPSAVCINAGLGTHSLDLPGVPPLTIINCYGSSRVTARAVASILTRQGVPAADSGAEGSLRAELATLATESSNERFSDLAALETIELVKGMNGEDATVPAAIAGAAPAIAEVIDGVAERMSRGGRLIYVGAGTPGRLGILDASECPPTFGVDPSRVVGVIAGGSMAIQSAVENAEDDVAAGAVDMAALGLSATDSVIGISASGRTPYVLAALQAAASAGALTVGFACNSGSPVGRAAEIALEIEVGPEFLAGSTRLKAGTAQKLVLNMLSTIVMVRLGKTYRNLMVDLRATNEKLRARSERTVMRATGVDALTSAAVLESAAGSVKVAILVIMTGLSVEQATALLQRHGGHLDAAIGSD